MEAKLRAAFDSWTKGPEAQKPEIKFTEPKPGYYFVRKTDVNQTSIACSISASSATILTTTP